MAKLYSGGVRAAYHARSLSTTTEELHPEKHRIKRKETGLCVPCPGSGLVTPKPHYLPILKSKKAIYAVCSKCQVRIFLKGMCWDDVGVTEAAVVAKGFQVVR